MKPLSQQFLHLVAVLLVLTASNLAMAQTYPTRPVRVLVPYSAGGPTDIFARLIAQKLSERIGKQFYVENVAGASGNIGTAQAARSTPDGNTLLVAYNSYAVNPTIFAKIPYDPYKDFDPVTLAVTSTTVLAVNPSVQAKTVDELVALIRANPGKYAWSHGGVGTATHLVGEKFRLTLGLDLVAVPYNNGGPATAAVVAGHTPFGFNPIAAAVPQIKEGNLRALAVTSKTRSPSVPNVPTMIEAGYADIWGDSWVGVLVPAGTPHNIVVLLNRKIVSSITQPDMKERLIALGFDPVGSTPEQFAERIKFEIETWGQVIRMANIKVH
jgi:tripartite-type tricarboxylate transporter receptor subunit TctC